MTDCAHLKRLPCSVCGLETFRHKGWFLVEEDFWQSRLRILSWHSSLALNPDTRTACCQEHLRTLVEDWLFSSWTRHIPPKVEVQSRNYDLSDEQLPLGELIVDRDSFRNLWAGPASCLESMLDALLMIGSENPRDSLEVQLYSPATAEMPDPIWGVARN